MVQSDEGAVMSKNKNKGKPHAQFGPSSGQKSQGQSQTFRQVTTHVAPQSMRSDQTQPSAGRAMADPGARQTLAQQRAKHALEKITGYQSRPDDAQKRFNSYVASLGPMILMNGFGQACAFYIANEKSEHKDVLQAVEEWLKKKGRPFHEREEDIIRCITNGDERTYRLARLEALAYLDWLKKFAKAFLKSEEQGDTQ
jgi:CRISPR-associated protein Cmr5